MTDAFGAMLDSGVLYLAVGAVICVILGVGAVWRLFQGAKKAEPPSASGVSKPGAMDAVVPAST